MRCAIIYRLPIRWRKQVRFARSVCSGSATLCLWSGMPKLLGRQGAGATDVNFADQVDVYLLHDRERVIYFGRAADTSFTRLKTHTTDRLGGRWDKLSWFRDCVPSITTEHWPIPECCGARTWS
jgi:hypothetical protein